MKYLFSHIVLTFLTQILLTACQLGTGISGKYVCYIEQKPDYYSFSVGINFMPDGYVEIKREQSTQDESPGLFSLYGTPVEAPYTVKSGRIKIDTREGEIHFKSVGDKIIATQGFLGRECKKQ